MPIGVASIVRAIVAGMGQGMSNDGLPGLLGEGVSTTLLARAFEPGAGEHAHGDHSAACLNCGTALVGSHCHACGQPAHVHRTIAAFFHDLAHGVFHFEGKIWRTLPMLAFHPGQLTRDYIDGKRASYVSPIALFLFCVFLLFAVVKDIGGTIGDNAKVNVDGKSVTGLAANEREVERLKQQRATLVAQHQSTAAIDPLINAREQAVVALRGLADPLKFSIEANEDVGKFSSIPEIDKAVREARANPQLTIYKLQNYSYKYAWALIPISVPLVWLLFPFSRRFGLYDHTVFVTYSLCFMSLLVVMLSLGNAAGLPLIGLAAIIVPPWHMYRQVKGAYGLGRFGALWRMSALMVFALIALLLFTVFVILETSGLGGVHVGH